MIVLRCLEKSPDDRFQTVGELASALADCQASDDWTRDDAKRWWMSRGQVGAEVLATAGA